MINSEMKALLESLVPTVKPDVDLEFKSMFGGIAGYVNGRVFVSLSDMGLALKLATDDQVELITIEGAKYLQYSPDAPVSKSYIVVPPDFLTDHEKLKVWLAKSIAYCLTLPLPKKKSKKK